MTSPGFTRSPTSTGVATICPGTCGLTCEISAAVNVPVAAMVTGCSETVTVAVVTGTGVEAAPGVPAVAAACSPGALRWQEVAIAKTVASAAARAHVERLFGQDPVERLVAVLEAVSQRSSAPAADSSERPTTGQ